MDNTLLQENGFHRTCSVCGNKLTRYGSKILKDGILCRNCARLTSEWLDNADYAEKTVEQIKEHLAYRQNNKEKLAGFKGNKAVEGKYSLYIDDESKDFLISKRADYIRDNADIFNIDDISKIQIEKRKYLNRDGSDIYLHLFVRHPEFTDVKFQVNEFGYLNPDSDDYQKALKLAYEYADALKSRK